MNRTCVIAKEIRCRGVNYQVFIFTTIKLFLFYFILFSSETRQNFSNCCPFKTKEKTCVLVESNVGLSGLLEEDYAWTYFEKLDTQVSYREFDQVSKRSITNCCFGYQLLGYYSVIGLNFNLYLAIIEVLKTLLADFSVTLIAYPCPGNLRSSSGKCFITLCYPH
jgi:hypothetical protein